MRVLWSWLCELCDFDTAPSVEHAANMLTARGLEVEELSDLGAGFRGVVVAEVVGKTPHPNADKLTLVDVINARGGAATQVVCGAANVPAPGRKVLWAQVGAVLPGGTLTAKTVKGIVSPGMLCAEDELGVSEDHAGIVVLDDDDRTELGAPAQRALGLADWVLDVNAPANRSDLLGHLGIARELVAALGGRLREPNTDLAEWTRSHAPRFRLEIANRDWCPRYTARFLDGVTVRPSPRRFAQRLRALGVRAISNLVDVSNYVMLELGQPLHAFDADRLPAETISVSPARDNEKFTTLDNVERILGGDDLVVRSGDTAIALAGVMGGLDSEVTDRTTRVVLESASFHPLSVRRTARRLGLSSEASLRFGRGVDPELVDLASRRAARLMCELGGGTVSDVALDQYPGKRQVRPIAVRLPHVRRVTGVEFTETACSEALESLGFDVTIASGHELDVVPPSARADVTREVDVIEEILRVTGYDQVPSTIPALRQAPTAMPLDRADAVRRALAAAGGAEAITYGFQSAERHGSLGISASDRRAQPIAIHNPMTADQAVMRTSLLPNLIAAVARNHSFGRHDVNLFEVGNVFLRRGEGVGEAIPHDLADEPIWAAGVLAGRRAAQIGAGAPFDAFDAKALALTAIRAVAGDVDIVVEQTVVPYFHPGVCGRLHMRELGARDAIIGWFGELHPDVRARLGVTTPVFAFEVDLSALPLAAPAQMRPIPKFPGSERDVSLLVAETISAGQVADVIAAAAEPLVAGVKIIEEYRDVKLGDGRKSMLWSIAYRSPDRTLTDTEVDAAHSAIVARLIANLPAQQR